MTKPDDAYWQTKEGAAFNAVCELCNPEASMEERLASANLLRTAFDMPTGHSDVCSIHDTDEPDASDCDCGYWAEPKAA